MFVVLLRPGPGQARLGGRPGGGEAPPPPVLAGNLPVKILSVVDKKVRQESQPERDSQAVRPASQQHQTLSRSELRYQRGERGGTSASSRPARTAQWSSSDINIISQQQAGM